MQAITPSVFLHIGSKYTKTKSKESDAIRMRRFKSFFGVTPQVCFIVWRLVKDEAPPYSHPKHLLWCLNFLKEYSGDHNRKALFDVDEKTVRKWTWIFVELVSNMNVIIWDKRYDGSVRGQTCFVSLDGIDIKILEPTPFETRWYSHKLNTSGLRYEIGLNIRTGHIVWTFGGYPCGTYPDLCLAREAFVLALGDKEKAMGDKGYKDPLFITPNDNNGRQHKLIMSRHETVNKRLRQFKILKIEFRHDRQKHPMVFAEVSNLTQLMIESGEPLFAVV